MKKNFLFWLKIHRMADDGDGGGEGDSGGGDSLIPEAGGGRSPDDAGDPPHDPPGDNGDDDQSWFKKDKYKTVEDQAKAYNELEKKLGEKNEMLGAPEGGKYELTFPEGIEGEFIEGDPLMEAFTAKAAELNLSQGAFDQLLHTYLEQEAASLQVNKEKEIKDLGDNADRRLDALGKWGSANLDAETYEIFRGVASTAEGVKLLEALVSNSRDHRIKDEQGGHVPQSGLTPESVKEMANKKNEHGQLLASIDPNYKKKVDQAYRDLYGDEPVKTVIGG